jgi:hypothetical protein
MYPIHGERPQQEGGIPRRQAIAFTFALAIIAAVALKVQHEVVCREWNREVDQAERKLDARIFREAVRAELQHQDLRQRVIHQPPFCPRHKKMVRHGRG